MREADQPDILVQEVFELCRIEMPGLWVDLPFTDLDPPLGQPAPRAGIGLMVLIGHDDRLTGLHHLAESLRQHIGVLRGGGAKAQLLRRHVKDRGHAGAGFVHLLPTKAAGLIGAVGLHLSLGVEAMQPVDDLAAGVRPTGVLKESLPLKARLGEGGKLGADPFGINMHGAKVDRSAAKVKRPKKTATPKGRRHPCCKGCAG